MNEALHTAAEAYGGAGKLAKALRVTPQTMSQWVNEERPLPEKYCPRIEDLTQVPCERLRPGSRWVRVDGRVLLDVAIEPAPSEA